MEIRSIKDVVEDDGVLIPTFKYIKISSRYTKRYHGSLEKLIQLNYMERYLIDFLAEEAGADCIVRTDKFERKKFIDFMLRISQSSTEIHYKDNGVRASLQTLKKLLLLIPIPNQRGICWVNPAYFYRLGSEKLRLKMVDFIKGELEKA